MPEDRLYLNPLDDDEYLCGYCLCQVTLYDAVGPDAVVRDETIASESPMCYF